MWTGPDGRRYFGVGDTCDEGHQPGDRHDDSDRLLEWTGQVWTPVCPVDDVAMGAYDDAGFLCCLACGMRASDLEGVDAE